jgi:S1-C subfamily serine protease
VYLADIHIIPGNSGSPLFVMPTFQIGVPATFGLLGVVSGYMIENEDATLTATTTWTGSVNANSGIAMVVPAEQLKEVLDTPELQQLREAAVQRTLSTQPQANPNATL